MASTKRKIRILSKETQQEIDTIDEYRRYYHQAILNPVYATIRNQITSTVGLSPYAKFNNFFIALLNKNDMWARQLRRDLHTMLIPHFSTKLNREGKYQPVDSFRQYREEYGMWAVMYIIHHYLYFPQDEKEQYPGFLFRKKVIGRREFENDPDPLTHLIVRIEQGYAVHEDNSHLGNILQENIKTETLVNFDPSEAYKFPGKKPDEIDGKIDYTRFMHAYFNDLFGDVPIHSVINPPRKSHHIELRQAPDPKGQPYKRNNGWTLPGYNFCGPGNDLSGHPTSVVDALCQWHDMQYQYSPTAERHDDEQFLAALDRWSENNKNIWGNGWDAPTAFEHQYVIPFIRSAFTLKKLGQNAWDHFLSPGPTSQFFLTFKLFITDPKTRKAKDPRELERFFTLRQLPHEAVMKMRELSSAHLGDLAPEYVNKLYKVYNDMARDLEREWKLPGLQAEWPTIIRETRKQVLDSSTTELPIDVRFRPGTIRAFVAHNATPELSDGESATGFLYHDPASDRLYPLYSTPYTRIRWESLKNTWKEDYDNQHSNKDAWNYIQRRGGDTSPYFRYWFDHHDPLHQMVSPEARDMAMSAKDPEDAYKYGFRWTATENRGPDLLHDVTITYDKKLDIRENPNLNISDDFAASLFSSPGGKRKADGEGEGAPPNSVLVVDPEASVETVNSSDPDSGVGTSVDQTPEASEDMSKRKVDDIEGNEGKGATQKAQKGDMSGLVGNISVGLAPIQNFLTPTRMTLRFECVRRNCVIPFLGVGLAGATFTVPNMPTTAVKTGNLYKSGQMLNAVLIPLDSYFMALNSRDQRFLRDLPYQRIKVLGGKVALHGMRFLENNTAPTTMLRYQSGGTAVQNIDRKVMWKMFDRERDFCWMTGNYSFNVLQLQDINATNYNQCGYNSNCETEATDNKWESRQPFKQACMLSVGSGSDLMLASRVHEMMNDHPISNGPLEFPLMGHPCWSRNPSKTDFYFTSCKYEAEGGGSAVAPMYYSYVNWMLPSMAEIHRRQVAASVCQGSGATGTIALDNKVPLSLIPSYNNVITRCDDVTSSHCAILHVPQYPLVDGTADPTCVYTDITYEVMVEVDMSIVRNCYTTDEGTLGEIWEDTVDPMFNPYVSGGVTLHEMRVNRENWYSPYFQFANKDQLAKNDGGVPFIRKVVSNVFKPTAPKTVTSAV